MAYNPNLYYPPTYPMNQTALYNGPVQQPVNGLISVTGIEGAKAYKMPPNSSMPLFDSGEDILYVKTTDAGGYPTIRTFKFSPVEQQQEPQQAYATKADLAALVAKVEELAKRSEGVKQNDE